jgi:tetratricopeptide (TPR) repeat protein
MPARSLGCALLVALLFVGVAAAAPGRVLPTVTLQAALERERAAGGARSEALAGALLHVSDAAPEARRTALLQAAAQADPALAAPHLARAREALRHADVPRTCSALTAAWRAARLDAREESLWMRRGTRALYAWLAATLATLAILFTLRSAPLAVHALGVRFGSRFAAAIAAASLLACAFTAATMLGVLAAAALATPFMRRRERICMAAVCILLAAVEIGTQTCAPRAVLLDPRTDSARVARLANGGTDPELEARWVRSPSRTATQEFLLGLRARRQGDYAVAQSHYVACLRQDSTFVPAYVNLANLFFYSGQYDRAAVGYRTATLFAPADPTPRYDLAQAYIRTTHYAEADGELAAAAERGMAAAERRASIWHDDARPVLDATLSKQQILDQARAEAQASPRFARTLLLSWRGAYLGGLRGEVDIASLLVVAVLLLFGLRLGGLTIRCSGCGTMVCAHCAGQETQEPLCSACMLPRPRTGPREFGGEGAPPPPRRRMSLATGRWVGVLFPGAGDVARECPVRATLAIAAAWIGLLASGSLVDAARSRTSLWIASIDAPLLAATVILVLVVWLLSLLRLRPIVARRRDPVRASVGA